MPWTISHIAAVLPLRRSGAKPLSFAALALGACSPDFAYYIGQFKWAELAHTPLGILFLCLPCCLLLLALLQLFQHELASLLPTRALRGALHARQAPSLRSWRNLAAFSIAIVLGAATHIVWDAFTHKTAWPVANSALLQTPFVVAGQTVGLYNLLQHASTLIGAVILLLVYRSWVASDQAQAFSAQQPHTRAPLYLLAALVVTSLLAAWGLGLVFSADDTSGGYPFSAALVNFVLHSSAAFVALLFALLLFKKLKAQTQKSGS